MTAVVRSSLLTLRVPPEVCSLLIILMRFSSEIVMFFSVMLVTLALALLAMYCRACASGMLSNSTAIAPALLSFSTTFVALLTANLERVAFRNVISFRLGLLPRSALSLIAAVGEVA